MLRLFNLLNGESDTLIATFIFKCKCGDTEWAVKSVSDNKAIVICKNCRKLKVLKFGK